MEKLLTTGKKNRNKLRRMRADLPLVTVKEKQKGIFMTDELLNERYALAIERIRQIPAEKAFRSRTAIFLHRWHSTSAKWTRSGAESQKDI